MKKKFRKIFALLILFGLPLNSFAQGLQQLENHKNEEEVEIQARNAIAPAVGIGVGVITAPISAPVAVGVAVGAAVVAGGVYMYNEHKKNQTPSNRNKHEEGQARKQRDNGGEKKEVNNYEIIRSIQKQISRNIYLR